MHRILLSLVLLPASAAVALASTDGTHRVAATQASPAEPARLQAGSGDDALDGAVAGVLVAALSEEFGGRAVSIMLDEVRVQPASPRDRVVTGQGRARIEGDQDWIGFRFNTLYDTTFGSAAYPEIRLGGVTRGEREVPNDTALVRQLDDNVVARLGKEFAHQSVRLQLDRIRTVEAGSRYLRIEASGIADFGLEGTTPAQIEALYDRRGGAWLRVSYELGPSGMRAIGALAGN